MNSSEPGAGRRGEASSAQEDGVDASDERPLKKARFAWQVKGKYHLKQPEITENPSSPGPAEAMPPSDDDSSSDNDSLDNEVAASAEQNLEILGDYLLKQDFNIMAKSASSVTAEGTAAYPRYVPSREQSEAGADGARENIPLSLVRSRNTAEDQYLARWQARQMAKGFVDNTINRVLDSWPVAPLSCLEARGPDNADFALDVVQFIDNLPGNNTIENEGILMAISAHGLQTTAASPRMSESAYRAGLDDEGRADSDESCEAPNKEESGECDAPSWKDFERPCICSHTLRENLASAEVRPLVPFHHRDPATPYAYLPQPVASNSAAKTPADSTSSESESSRDDEAKASSGSENIFNEHFDFMDAAVSFAIQNKGLTSFGTGYG